MQSKDPSKQPVNAAIGLSCLVGHVENNPMLLADSTIFEMMCECLEVIRKGLNASVLFVFQYLSCFVSTIA
eukprot:m.100385 g.100385  ORF g.100385 m.100385 type:complete len:71 (+) comp9044_c0_seq9:313-525(+)